MWPALAADTGGPRDEGEKVRLVVGTQMWPQGSLGVPVEPVQTLTLLGHCPWAMSSIPCWCWQQGHCKQGSPGSRGEPWDPPAQRYLTAGLDPPRRHPPRAGAGLGGTGSPVGSDFSPGSSARLPPHSCPLLLLLLAGGVCPSSGPIPGMWPSSPKAAPTPLPCTALLTPSASPGPRGVMSGETPHPPLWGTHGTVQGEGADGPPGWVWVGEGAGWVLAFSPYTTVGHPPMSCHRAALSPACLLPGSRQEGAVAPPESARSCRVPVSPPPDWACPKWLEPRTPCVPLPAPPASARAALVLPPNPG